MPETILDSALDTRLRKILSPFRRPDAWRDLQLTFAPQPSAVVLLSGPSGTGKTTIARYMGRAIHASMAELSFSSVASADFGATEAAILKAFEDNKDTTMLFLDEVDGILWDRAKITENTMHMLPVVNTLLTCIDKFVGKGGILVMTTNLDNVLDAALVSRITDHIRMGMPSPSQARSLWRYKLPACIKPSKAQMDILIEVGVTPRAMEHIILDACRSAFEEDRDPVWADLLLSIQNHTA